MVTRMDVDGYVHVVEGGEYMYFEDHQREVAQLQARVAELEAAVKRALQIGRTLIFEHANDPTVDHNGRTADAVLEAYNGLRAVATSVGVWTK